MPLARQWAVRRLRPNRFADRRARIRPPIEEYRTNEVAADERFKGRTIVLDGVVDGISKDFLDNPYLTIRTGVMYQTIHADFDDRHKSDLARLQRGKRVRIKGRVKGMMIGSVILGNCQLVQ